MAVFTIQTPEGRKLKIEAPDEATAIRGAQTWSLQQKKVAKPAPKKGVGGEILGGVMNLYESIPFMDEGAAALDSAYRLASGQAKTGKGVLSDVGEAWRQSRDLQDVNADDFAERRPIATSAIRTTGAVGSSLIPAGRAAGMFGQGSRAANMARGALLAGTEAAVYAGADKGSLQERASAATKAATDPLTLALGAGGGALAPVTPRPAKPKAARPQKVLEDAGVFLTPGQKVGGIAKSAEDLGQRAPILGPAIRGARQRGVESLNRAYANRALEPLGETVPTNLKSGHDSVAYVAERLGREYDDAAAMVPRVDFDDEFRATLDALDGQLAEYGGDVAQQYRTILNNRLFSRVGDGPVTGAMLREIQSDIGGRAAKFSASDNASQQGLGEALEMVSDELKSLLGRANPEAGARISRANQGWSVYVRLRNAASKAKGGVATPGQFRTAVRMLDRSVGKGAVAQGRAIGQDLSDAASEIMPDAFGNPGTADAVGLGALGTTALLEPTTGLPMAAGLTAAATPYFLMGRKIVDALPANATRGQLMQAAAQLRPLAAQDPQVAALYRQVAAKLASGAGALGGTQIAPAQ